MSPFFAKVVTLLLETTDVESMSGAVVSAVTEPVIGARLEMAAELPAASVMVKSTVGATAPLSPVATVNTKVSLEDEDADTSVVTDVAILLAVEGVMPDTVTTSVYVIE